MKTSNLAQRLEEFEATLQSLRLTQEPATRMFITQESDAPSQPAARRPRRPRRPGGIQLRHQGLRAFRVS
jgi:hypothetical protein